MPFYYRYLLYLRFSRPLTYGKHALWKWRDLKRAMRTPYLILLILRTSFHFLCVRSSHYEGYTCGSGLLLRSMYPCRCIRSHYLTWRKGGNFAFSSGPHQKKHRLAGGNAYLRLHFPCRLIDAEDHKLRHFFLGFVRYNPKSHPDHFSKYRSLGAEYPDRYSWNVRCRHLTWRLWFRTKDQIYTRMHIYLLVGTVSFVSSPINTRSGDKHEKVPSRKIFYDDPWRIHLLFYLLFSSRMSYLDLALICTRIHIYLVSSAIWSSKEVSISSGICGS